MNQWFKMMWNVFLHKKAIEFEKMTWAITHLVFVESDELVLAGYFSLANRPLKISEKISKSYLILNEKTFKIWF